MRLIRMMKWLESGIKFNLINVLKCASHTLELIRAKREQRLLSLLSVKEVWSILNL